MKCPHCKKIVPDGSLYCPECGQTVSGYSDTSQEVEKYWDKVQRENDRADQIRKEELAKAEQVKRNKTRVMLLSVISIVVVGLVAVYFLMIRPNIEYSSALKLMDAEQYNEATDAFQALGNHKDAMTKMKECKYYIAEALFENKEYQQAFDIYSELEKFNDSEEKANSCIQKILDEKYEAALEFLNNNQYSNAEPLLEELAENGYYSRFAYLEDLSILKKEVYTGNEGDSFVDVLGTRNGTADIHGNEYSHGLEAWIARWNYEDEKSWAYSVYKLPGDYHHFRAQAVLLSCYNEDNFDATLKVYADEDLIGQYELTPSSIPFDIDLYFNSAESLKIYVFDNKPVSGGTSFGIVNAILTDDFANNNDGAEVGFVTNTKTEEVPEPTKQADFYEGENSPFKQKYWIIFTEGNRSDRVEASTIDSSISPENLYFVWDSSVELNDTSGSQRCDQFYLADSNSWDQIGDYSRLTDWATNIIASNLDVYDSSGNLICKKVQYQDIDWDKINFYR